jgi:hypothetical protein
VWFRQQFGTPVRERIQAAHHAGAEQLITVPIAGYVSADNVATLTVPGMSITTLVLTP